MNTMEIKRENMIENTTEKALTIKGEKSLTKNNQKGIVPILKVATGIVFYTATFIVSVALGYLFVLSVFNY